MIRSIKNRVIAVIARHRRDLLIRYYRRFLVIPQAAKRTMNLLFLGPSITYLLELENQLVQTVLSTCLNFPNSTRSTGDSEDGQLMTWFGASLAEAIETKNKPRKDAQINLVCSMVSGSISDSGLKVYDILRQLVRARSLRNFGGMAEP